MFTPEAAWDCVLGSSQSIVFNSLEAWTQEILASSRHAVADTDPTRVCSVE
jgi:hypothetical protein